MHEIRASTKYVSYSERKKVTAALRPIYTAANEHDALAELERFDQEWGEKYPMIAHMWRRDWEHIIPFLSLPGPLRKAVYTTDESVKSMRRDLVGFSRRDLVGFSYLWWSGVAVRGGRSPARTPVNRGPEGGVRVGRLFWAVRDPWPRVARVDGLAVSA